MFKWTSLLIPPTTVLIVNLVGIVAGVSYAINSGYQSWGPLFETMEAITEGVSNLNVSEPKKNRIQVSNTKKSLFFYVNLAKRFMQQYNEVELSALGMAIATGVTVAEILKNNGLAVEKKIRTLTVDMRDDPGARPIPKAKIEIVLGKTENFDELMATEAEQREYGGDMEEQQQN
ncbi:hypothetical protein LguiA_036469 [Lonicera macranthoides]